MAKYRVVHKAVRLSASRHEDWPDVDSTDGQRLLEPGDVVEDPPEEWLRSFPDRFEEVYETPEPEEIEEPEPEEIEEPEPEEDEEPGE